MSNLAEHESRSKKPIPGIVLVIAGFFILIFLLVAAVVGMAVVSAFIFSNSGGEHQVHTAYFSAYRYAADPDSAVIENNGKQDLSAVDSIKVIVDGKEISPTTGELTSKAGSRATYSIESWSNVTITGRLNDGSWRELQSMKV